MLSTLILGAGAALVAAAPPSYGKFPFDFHHGHYHHSFSFSTGASLVAPVATGTGTAPSFSAPIATGTGYPYAVSAFNATNTTSSYLTTGVGSSTAVVLSTGVSSSVVAPVATSAVAATSTGSSEVSAVSAASGCTFTDAASAISGKKSCTTIVLQDITVPAGTTLDMTDLEDGTTVVFAGTTTFEYEAWDGPLIYVSGTSITVQGETGHVIDGNGAKWWDGEGSNGGVTKPKFFYAHDLTDSTITGLNILNTPVQCFSVDNANNLKIVDVTIDDSAGDAGDLGHNTDAFDVGSSTGVYISGATVKNQDDCLAINSGTDISFTGGSCSGGHGLSIGSVGGRSDNTVENIYIAVSQSQSQEDHIPRMKLSNTEAITNHHHSPPASPTPRTACASRPSPAPPAPSRMSLTLASPSATSATTAS